MLRRILLAAIPAGLIAGAVLSVAQLPQAIPLIHRAETYERGDAPEAARDAHAAPAHPARRLALTVLGNELIGIAYGLLLAAGISLRGDREIDARRGMLWGLAGFAAFALAPALGLPPELPGTHTAGLGVRQLWWAFTVVATAGGLALILLSGRLVAALAGAVLLALPHAIGAPHPVMPGGMAPEALTREFVTASLLAAFAFWVVLGGAVGHFYRRLGGG